MVSGADSNWVPRRPGQLVELLTELVRWRDGVEGRDVILVCGSGGGAGCGHVSIVRTAAAREYAEPDLTQLTVGPASGSVVPIAPPWWSASGELGAGNAAQASSVGVSFTHTDVRREVNYGVLTVGVHGESPGHTGASDGEEVGPEKTRSNTLKYYEEH